MSRGGDVRVSVHGWDTECGGDGSAGAKIVDHKVNVPTGMRWGRAWRRSRLERIPLCNREHFAEFVYVYGVREAAVVPIGERGDAVHRDLPRQQS